jgi:segregation and condensation protein B
VETSGVIRTLLERKLVRIVGRKEEPGRPIMYGTTKFFLEHFGLRDLSQLPPLREFRELGESEQAMLPIDESVEVVGGSLSQPPEASVQEQPDGAQGEGTPIEVNGTAIEMGEINTNVENEFVAANVTEES